MSKYVLHLLSSKYHLKYSDYLLQQPQNNNNNNNNNNNTT